MNLELYLKLSLSLSWISSLMLINLKKLKNNLNIWNLKMTAATVSWIIQHFRNFRHCSRPENDNWIWIWLCVRYLKPWKSENYSYNAKTLRFKLQYLLSLILEMRVIAFFWFFNKLLYLIWISKSCHQSSKLNYDLGLDDPNLNISAS